MKLAPTLLLLATAASMPHAHQIDERSFEGGVLERRAQWTQVGCFSSAGSLTLNGTYIYQTSLACETVAGQHKVIALTGGDTCYYGDTLPPTSDKIDDSNCNVKCLAYSEMCGGNGAYTVYSTGDVSAAAADESSSSSSSSSTTDAPSSTVAPSVSVVTGGGSTVVVTQAAPTVAAVTASAAPSSTHTADSGSSNHSNTPAIAAGVVVGVVGLAALIAGVFFFLRSRKQREQKAELQRQNSIAGLRSEKPPSTYSMPDSRLEPAYMRRMSDGSIADNQDYSRRILKVTNPSDG